jgi:hypothetical protein
MMPGPCEFLSAATTELITAAGNILNAGRARMHGLLTNFYLTTTEILFSPFGGFAAAFAASD